MLLKLKLGDNFHKFNKSIDYTLFALGIVQQTK